MSILGTKPAPLDGLPAGAPRGRDAERILAAELLAEFRAFQQTMTQFAERIAGRVTNHVLEVRSRAFDANATPILLSYGAPVGAIVVRAPAHSVTIATGPQSGTTAPTVGLGVWTVPANSVDTVPVAAREITLYGTAADIVQYSVLTTAPLAVAS